MSVEIPTRADFERLLSEVRAVRELLEGATVVPRKEWGTVSEAAAHYGVSRDTIYRKIDTGELQTRGKGKMRRVRLV